MELIPMKKILYFSLLAFLSILFFGCTTDTPSYEVTFDQIIDNAPSVEPQSIQEGQVANQPTYIESIIYNELTYQFDGWFVEDVLFDFSIPITQNVELEAKWKEIVTFPALLFDLSDYETVVTISNIYIVRVISEVSTILRDHLYFNVLTKYSIEVEEMILGTFQPEYLYVLGGEEEHNIYRYFSLYPQALELDKYYLVIRLWSFEAETDEANAMHVAGHSVILLDTYDSSKTLSEQDESVLELIQPYIDAINS